MAKRSHAAKGLSAPGRPKRRSPSPMQFTAELLADGRRRYEQTSESLYPIAADFGIHRTTFSELAKREGWVRHRPAPRELSAATRLLAQTERLEAEAMALWRTPQPAAGFTAGPLPEAGGEEEAVGAQAPIAPPNPMPNPMPDSIAASIDWLHRSLRGQIAAVEALRARMSGAPQTAQEAAVIARTLVSLTGALHKLQRMACGPSQAGQDNDNLPTDLDDFRDQLARRIDAFVASRTDPDDAERNAAAPPVDAAGG